AQGTGLSGGGRGNAGGPAMGNAAGFGGETNLKQVGAGFSMNPAQEAFQKQKQQQTSLVGAAGGHMGDASKPILVGDNEKGTARPAKQPTGHEEMVINLNPKPDDQLLILSNPETREMMNGDTSLVPRAATGVTLRGTPLARQSQED